MYSLSFFNCHIKWFNQFSVFSENKWIYPRCEPCVLLYNMNSETFQNSLSFPFAYLPLDFLCSVIILSYLSLVWCSIIQSLELWTHFSYQTLSIALKPHSHHAPLDLTWRSSVWFVYLYVQISTFSRIYRKKWSIIIQRTKNNIDSFCSLPQKNAAHERRKYLSVCVGNSISSAGL